VGFVSVGAWAKAFGWASEWVRDFGRACEWVVEWMSSKEKEVGMRAAALPTI
jgi:hypothetical protein